MEYNFEVFSRQYPVVVFFVQHLAYYRGLKAKMDDLTYHKEFWVSTVDGHLKLATIVWCNVFGSRKADTHWTKTSTGNTTQQDRQNFRHRLLSRLGFTQEQWETYHKAMLAFRDKFVAHIDLRKSFDDPVPSFDPALQVAYAYQEWVKEFIKASLDNSTLLVWEDPAFNSLYEECKADATSIIIQQLRP